MRDAGVFRQELDGADPARLAEVDLDHLLREEVVTVGRHLDAVERDDVVGFAELPALLEGRCFGQVGGIALRCPGLRPVDDRFDLGRGERDVVRPHVPVGVAAPRGHVAVLHRASDRAGPRPCFPVRHERHRGDLAGSMALHAVLEEDRRDVAAVGRRVGRGGRGCRDQGEGERCRQCEGRGPGAGGSVLHGWPRLGCSGCLRSSGSYRECWLSLCDG